MRKIFFFSLLFVVASQVIAQKGDEYITTVVDGKVLRAIVFEGDTIPVFELDSVRITTKQNFQSRDEYRQYNQMRYNALKVYPYAAEAIRLYRENQQETADMNRRGEKRYNREREDQLSDQYTDKLKSLTKAQGYILIKIIERELQRPFYDVVHELRGGWEAFKWQSTARWYGFNLRDGYDPQKDPMLEMILADLNINYGKQ